MGNQELKNVPIQILESLVTKDVYCTEEIRSRIDVAKSASTKKKSHLTWVGLERSFSVAEELVDVAVLRKSLAEVAVLRKKLIKC